MGRIVVIPETGRNGLARVLAFRLGDILDRRDDVVMVGKSTPDGGIGTAPAEALVWIPSGPGETDGPDDGGQPQVDALEAALDALAPARLVAITSTEIYEPHAHHPGQVTEDHPATRRSGNPVAAHWRALEAAVERCAAARRGLRLTVLRTPPVPLPPPQRDGDGDGSAAGEGRTAVDPWNLLLGRRWAGVPVGFDPVLQFLHPEDLATAVARVIARAGDDGATAETFHLAPTAPVPCRRGLALAGVRCVPLPRRLLIAVWRRRRVARTAHPDFLRHPWTVSADAARQQLGWAPRHSSAAALAAASDVVDDDGRRSRLRRQLESWDEHGMDPAFIRRLSRTAFRFLHQVWHRVEVAGLERVPASGPAVLAGVHRGFVPLDAMLALHEISGGWRQGRDASPHRIPRFLVHPGLLKAPFVAPLVTRLGGVPASAEHLERLLARGEVVGVFPEGVHGAFSRYREAYRVRPFVSDEFLRLARRHQAAVVPFVTLGSAEAFPVLGVVRWRWWKRTMEWPYIPLTPTFPWLPPVPLPTKWHTLYLKPLDPAGGSVRELRRQLRQRLQATLDDLRHRRRSWWWGRIFDP